MKLSKQYNLLLLGISAICWGCDAQEKWLDVKRNINDVMPSTIEDLQALLDNDNVFNQSYPMLGMVSADNFYLTDDAVGSLSSTERNTYLFEKDIFEGSNPGEFFNPYIKIQYANVVLEGLTRISDAHPQYSHIRGQALFLRAFSFYYLSQTFCMPFDRNTAATAPGIQVRLTADPNLVTPRSTVLETYSRMLTDLEEAVALLPEISTYRTRASKASAYGLMAKIHLCMGEYEKAANAAALALGINDQLLDFNSDRINPQSGYPFPVYADREGNPEIIFFASTIGYSSQWPAGAVHFIDSLLYESYAEGDLRKSLFYTVDQAGRTRFRGAYTGSFFNFGGIAVNELLLIRAESMARTGRWQQALLDLNYLLLQRFSEGNFEPYTADNEETALRILLEERRKELPFTGLARWEDLRRLNNDPRFAKTIVRVYKGSRYELLPGDHRYAFPLPDPEIQLSSVPQNPR